MRSSIMVRLSKNINSSFKAPLHIYTYTTSESSVDILFNSSSPSAAPVTSIYS
ncbi:hypothetical protein IGI04_020807 [Brassica rapa subsp. trilocularis]|uniref:Uncharacterized protein n=1 Tax=Brassica rapa subsp. trilocularis TaxID=1813537 RepID=A0ABQ7MJS7_BRACM|nr:hypothetical protein IGI04_020807 [Brassica rapa subsp. trilocularis]